eukprot:TRINITY_DN54943_c0_g1_i1.p1 TRINITY_DN54943_c0_g1~~TRINITY_DN54943_c0_g1_i1.p1  ORF type:complete len:357 (+),score=9.72 TRINITY_DN54943_c0_g1_i1:46-1116(+)
MKEIITALNRNLSQLIEQEGKKLQNLNDSIIPAQDHINYFLDNWIGEWMHQNYDAYSLSTGDYKIKDGYIFEYILKKTGIDLQKVEKEINNNVRAFRKFNNSVISDLSFIRDDEKYKQETQLLDKLENYEWGTNINDIIRLYRPNNLLVYDTSQVNRGLQTPPHVYVTAYYMSMVTECGACNNYIDLVKRLLRQVEIKNGYKASNTSEEILSSLFNNFHQFASQLKNRHDSRPTITINDEYDVQDLMHSILRLHFVDVRAEEYTPSYAGSSTRMDFLLKNEQIVIEVKKTRNNLKDKQIGDQLILDVAHYKNHPDCSILYCFVYDPENKVQNSRGLENDLSKQSNENLQVKVFIRP